MTVYVGQAPEMTEKYCKSSLCNTVSLLSKLNLNWCMVSELRQRGRLQGYQVID